MAVKFLDPEKIKIPEEFVLTANVFVREHGEEQAAMHFKGDKVTVNNMDKAELVLRGIAVTPEEWEKIKPAEKKEVKK